MSREGFVAKARILFTFCTTYNVLPSLDVRTKINILARHELIQASFYYYLMNKILTFLFVVLDNFAAEVTIERCHVMRCYPSTSHYMYAPYPFPTPFIYTTWNRLYMYLIVFLKTFITSLTLYVCRVFHEFHLMPLFSGMKR